MALLTDQQVSDFLEEHPEWARSDDELTRTFIFDDFEMAMEFVNRVAAHAELAGHHPDIDIRWNQVTLALSTHSEGGLTEKDTDFAAEMDIVA
jgi:4a-hydroxytetrahydrobiopterin dehydratase